MTDSTRYLLIDIPGGWDCGFPKPIQENYLKSEVLFMIWLSAEKYPDELIPFATQYYRIIRELGPDEIQNYMDAQPSQH